MCKSGYKIFFNFPFLKIDPSKTCPHHLKQSPEQETLANFGRAREVELVAQSRSKDKVVHVCRDGGQLRKCDKTAEGHVGDINDSVYNKQQWGVYL